MDIKGNLKLGIVISDKTSPNVLLCLDGTLRFMLTRVVKKKQNNDIIVFEDSNNGIIQFGVKLSEFEYYPNAFSYTVHGGYNRDLQEKCNGLCVPNDLLSKSNKFICNGGIGCQCVVYFHDNDILYASSLSSRETEFLKLYFKSQKPTMAFDEILKEIDNYIETTDFGKIIESCTIFNDSKYVSRPGRDDYYFIYKVRKTFDDKYIDSLFPVIHEEIYTDDGFCPYPDRNKYGEQAYKKEVDQYIANAKSKYDKNEHRRFLISQKFKEFEKQNLQYQQAQEDVLKSFVIEYLAILQTQGPHMPFANNLNKLLRSFYKGIHHYNLE